MTNKKKMVEETIPVETPYKPKSLVTFTHTMRNLMSGKIFEEENIANQNISNNSLTNIL